MKCLAYYFTGSHKQEPVPPPTRIIVIITYDENLSTARTFRINKCIARSNTVR